VADIDPQEFGRLQAHVEQLLDSNRQLEESVATMSAAIQSMQLQMAEAKGGWKLLMAIGGAAASAGGLISWLATHLMGSTPK
jgi:multidrug resistance efflux pump